MIAKSSFIADLRFGQEAEPRVAGALFQGGIGVEPASKQSYDFTTHHGPGHTELVEVKCEDKYAQRGNIFFELASKWPGRGEWVVSGMALSTATVAVHTLGENCAAYRVWDMRHRLAGETPREFRLSDNTKMGHVVPVETFADEAWGWFGSLVELPGSGVWSYDTTKETRVAP